MNKKLNIICVSIIIVLTLQSKSFTQDFNAEQIKEKFNESVVLIITYGFDGKPLAQGSGVIINDSG